MQKITVDGREIPLRYTMVELADMEEQIGTMDNFKDLILKGRRRLRNMVAAIRIMGNSGLAHEGLPADLTDEWLMARMDPGKLQSYQIAVLAAFTGGWKMETQEDTVRDPILEEIERKKEQGN